MVQTLVRHRAIMVGVFAAGLLAACATPVAPPPVVKAPPTCQAATSGDTLGGNWLSVRKQKGVAGELRTLFTLHPDGTMAYSEQLKRGKNPSQGLSEAGCWKRDAKILTLQTLQSNGAPIDREDPIYTNRYTIVSATHNSLSLRDDEGTVIKARRMSPGYRLPF